MELRTVWKLVSVPPSQALRNGTASRTSSALDLTMSLSRPLGADDQDRLALGGPLAHLFGGLIQHALGDFEIDDVDFVALAEDVRRHAGVPVPGLMSEMDTGFQHFTQGGTRHCGPPDGGSGLSGSEALRVVNLPESLAATLGAPTARVDPDANFRRRACGAPIIHAAKA